MCYRTTCVQCGKATWGGCGAHIEAALGGVPASERCRCEAELLEEIANDEKKRTKPAEESPR